MIMKAVRVDQFGGEDNLKLHKDIPVPELANDEILIKVKAAGVNPVDAFIRAGNFRNVSLPHFPGKDGAGLVEKVGVGVNDFHKDDRVIFVHSSGSYAEYCKVKENSASLLHTSLTFEQGASIGIPYYTAYASIVFKAKTQKGETVLINGASGAVGIAAIQILKALGCRVIGTAGSPEGLELVKRQGADFIFNHHEQHYMKRIKNEVTNGQGVDVILEMVAHVNLQTDLETMGFRGRTVIIGCLDRIEINPRLLMANESMITSIALNKTQETEWKEMHEKLFAGQAAGWLKPVVGKVYSLEDVGKAHYDVIHKSATQGKLILDVTK